MTLAPRIELRQTQTLAMTPALQQALRMLRMNNLALAEFVAAEVERNPLLELVAPPPPRGPIAAPPRGAPDGLEAIAAAVGLADHLHAQIGASRASPGVVAAAHALAEEIEDDGYLRTPLDALAARYAIPAAEAAAALELLQSCDPPGVAARSLAECLALQLRDRDRLDPAMRALLEHLPLVARGRSAELAARCGVDDEDLADMLAELRALDPKPGLRFAAAPVELAPPDVLVSRAAGGGWTVELNAETLPRVLVDNRYAAELGADGAARAFVAEMRRSAAWLARSLDQRARTVLRVATELVRRQAAFFEIGPAGLVPLNQRAIAEALGVHVSTVSRAAAGKTLVCARGVYPLSALFSVALPAGDGTGAIAAAAVQERIRRLLGDEAGGRPLSDARIAAVLRAEGIEVARRTVAKYREGMGIPSSVARRRGPATARR